EQAMESPRTSAKVNLLFNLAPGSGSEVRAMGLTGLCLPRFIVQIGSEPFLDFRDRHCLAPRVVLDLVAADLADGEVARFRMRQVETGNELLRRRQDR